MKTKEKTGHTLERASVAGVVATVMCIGYWFATNSMTITGPCGESCGLLIEGDPALIMTGLTLGLFVGIYRPVSQTPKPWKPVLMWRRFIAFIIDFYVVIMVVFAVLVTASLSIGALLYGSWNWQIRLVDTPPIQMLVFTLFGSSLLAVFAYFWLHAKFGRATVGKYIMGYTIIPAEEGQLHTSYAYGVFSAFLAMCSVHLWVWFVKDTDSKIGWYWWDRAGKTKALFVSV